MSSPLDRIPGKPPYRIAGIPPGIISSDDYDVTDEALSFLARHEALVNVARAAEEGQAIYDRFDDGTDLRSAYGKRKGDVQIELDRWCYRFFGPDGTLREALAALNKEPA